MALNYNKNKNHDGQDSMWTSYSDLFLGLSVVFLLLYVTASLRQGTDGIRQHMEYQRLSKENQDIRQQLKVYSTLKQEYLEKEAGNDEKQAYEELMNKLDLLQEDAKNEKIKLQASAAENEKKEKALNKYQQMIRNIMHANMIAKSRIKTRDTFIEGQEETITEQTTEISSLNKTVAEKKSMIAKSQAKIDGLEKNLEDKLKQLKNSYKHNQISKQKYEQQQKQLKVQAENQIASLKTQNAKTQNELTKLSSELNSTKGSLAQAEQNIAKMQSDFASQAKRDRAAFDAAIKKEKLTGSALAAREAKFRADAEQKQKALGDQIASLGAKYKAQGSELAKAQENLNARRNLASAIKANFAKNGIKADVDEKTGDVILSFGDQYFDSDSANLKNGMKKILEQAVPVYSSSLFDNAKIADKISNVEIVGYASPTFKGKYIDPRSLNPDDRAAVNYNLDLSYNRARSIFNHVFDQNKMQFKYQQKLLPLVKVTGRSFFDQADRNIASESPDSFCKKNDCAKLQRVIIKFNLKD